MPDYPYVLGNGKFPELFERISSAARPDRFSQDFLEKLGFASSNDRAFIPLLRRLGFIDDAGVPKPEYDDLRDPAKRPYTLALKVRELYSDLFAINTAINAASDPDVKAAMSRVSGKDENTAVRMANTFKSLVQQSKFEATPAVVKIDEAKLKETPPAASNPETFQEQPRRRQSEFHYNIQIVLPATTEVAVYNAIFKSLRENLDI